MLLNVDVIVMQKDRIVSISNGGLSHYLISVTLIRIWQRSSEYVAMIQYEIQQSFITIADIGNKKIIYKILVLGNSYSDSDAD